MIRLEVKTEGLDDLDRELLEETRQDCLSPIAGAVVKLEARAKEKLSVRGGPSRPGDPPALIEGALRDSIGRTGPYSRPGSVQAEFGVGVGTEARARVREWETRRGFKEGELFAVANLHEHGGIGKDGRRYPARSFIRTTEDELEAEIVADWTAALSRASASPSSAGSWEEVFTAAKARAAAMGAR